MSSTSIHCACVALMTALMFSVTWRGVFDDVMTENGPDHYAEKAWGPLKEIVPMPLNTLINLFYSAVGIYWLLKLSGLENRREILAEDAEMVYPFLWMAVFYGPIQLGRIITQEHRSVSCGLAVYKGLP